MKYHLSIEAKYLLQKKKVHGTQMYIDDDNNCMLALNDTVGVGYVYNGLCCVAIAVGCLAKEVLLQTIDFTSSLRSSCTRSIFKLKSKKHD